MPTYIYNRPDPGNFGYASYTGDGSTNSFAVSFAFPNKGRLASGSSSPYVKVYKDGVESAYTFTSTANDAISFSAAPASNVQVEVIREAGIAILETYTNGSDLDADTLAADSNRQSYVIQDVWTRLRALGATVGTLSTATAANEYNFTGDGATVNFTCGTETVTGDARVFVFLNGVRQATSAYNVVLASSVTQVQFLAAPGVGVAISVVVWNSPVLSTTVDDGSITTSKLANGSVSFTKLGMNATGSNGDVLVKRGGVYTTGALLPSEISGFDTQVRTSRLDQMAAPIASVNVNSQKITNLQTGTNTGDGVNKGQMDTAITTATAALNLSTCRFKGGSVSVSSTTFGSVSIGFAWDTIIVYVNNGNGDVGVRATNTTDVGGSGLNGSIYNPAGYFLLRRTNITASPQRLQIRQNVGAPASNDHEVEIQYIANAFQIRRSGTVAATYAVTYQVFTDYIG